MQRLSNNLIALLCSEKGYGSLFKASVVLVGCSLIAMSQAATLLYDKDLSAYKARFAIEVATNKPLDEIDCATIGNLQADCLMAKHEQKTLNTSVTAVNTIIRNTFWGGILLSCLSLIGLIGFLSFDKKTADKGAVDSK